MMVSELKEACFWIAVGYGKVKSYARTCVNRSRTEMLPKVTFLLGGCLKHESRDALRMFPVLYEINTRCWLRELSEPVGRPVTLESVPLTEFEQWKKYGFTHIWLMGAWSTGPLAQAQALTHPALRQSYSEAVPDWTEVDIAGSPYAIADYHIAKALGGDEALESFRNKLHEFGMRLLLDFVPNHLGVDHSWLRSQPELFVQSSTHVPD